MSDNSSIPSGSPRIESQILQWANIATDHHTVRPISDPPGYVATVDQVEGAWGYGTTVEKAVSDLRSVLIDWARLKLEHGDDDIPSMRGMNLPAE